MGLSESILKLSRSDLLSISRSRSWGLIDNYNRLHVVNPFHHFDSPVQLPFGRPAVELGLEPSCSKRPL